MAASAVNDALFAAAIVRGLAADDPASDERRLVCEDLELALTESGPGIADRVMLVYFTFCP